MSDQPETPEQKPKRTINRVCKYHPGQKYGRWTLVQRTEKKNFWLAKCECGTERAVFIGDLGRGSSMSCGCLKETREQIDERLAKAVATRAESAPARKARREKYLARLEEAKRKRAEERAAKIAARTPPPPKPTAAIIRYGMEWDRTSINDLGIEFYCYVNYAKMKTGYPREHHFKKAFQIVWPDFQWNEWCEMMLWAWCNYRIISVIGHSRASKTFYFSHCALLDYLANAEFTATTLTTTKFDALKSRMWGDMMRAVESMRPELLQNFALNYKITNTSNEMKVSINQPGKHGDDKFAIQGVATDSADKSAGKIRGQHADRRRIFVDEAQDVAPAIYTAFSNAMSAPDFRGVLLSNPVEKLSPFGEWCKPRGGWGMVTDQDKFWETEKPDGICLHFDGLQSPNVKAGKTLFPFLLTQSYVDQIRATNGEGSLEWWMYIRGFFPPDGVVSRVWPSACIDKASESVEFDYAPVSVATLDPAFEQDDPVLHLGKMGRTRDQKPCIRGEKTIRIHYKEGAGELPKDYQLARQAIALCREHGVPPENFIMDTTGNGRGVFAIIQQEWSNKIHGINYGGAATIRPLRLNDPKPANELVVYFVAELWFRASYLAMDGMLCGLNNLDPKTKDDLTARRYTVKQAGDTKKMVVEEKKDMKVRLGRSPDYGDSFVQWGELMVRKGMLGEVLGAAPTRWKNYKKLAQRAGLRFAEQKTSFAH